MIDLWLDDIRPAPEGWLRVTNLVDAKSLLMDGLVRNASLDHDLGACDSCMKGRTPDEWLEEFSFEQMPNCPHIGTGYDLVCWMEETGHWPFMKPEVHSANPVGAKRMRQAIDAEAARGRWF